ncbi:rhamnan synthesis F family protein [Sphingomonas sp. GC_Shp_3]|uniref:rhamnan synthesis F family protein n=1 Tax=Sphingomonas sp. GC_Shp_3 TaxID=2937383 RepID=UPI00226ADDDC|nr:rhamnan synthesis F family protein [Sphingomonas sp. GC_Shp_3]
MLARLGPELDAWVRAIAATDMIRNRDALDRCTAIGALLHNDAVRVAIDTFASEHSFDLDGLRAMLTRLDDEARVIAKSTLFDAVNYADQVPEGKHIADPAAHYLLLGERAGLKPSRNFDPTVYEEFNADVAASNHNRLFHYETWGRQEGRSYRDWLPHHAMPPLLATGDRPTVLLLLHEATYTGAPILGWNLAQTMSEHCNVVVVLRRGGALEQALRDVACALVEAPPLHVALDPDEMRRFATRLASVYKPLYTIANSVETRLIAIPLRRNGVPIVGLVHEFWPGRTPDVRLDFYACCAALVFPAQIVEQSSFRAFREVRLQNRFVLPQGVCAVPLLCASGLPRYGPPFLIDDHVPQPLDTFLSDGQRGTDPFTVIGLGAVEMRKGIDLFMSAATALRMKHPDITFRFIWLGSWQHATGTEYAAFLEEQFRRSCLEDCLFFYPPVDNLEPIYLRADTLFLSSRLDPMPNVAIDAAMRGIPVICFDGASGMAELLAADPDTASLVVPHLDSGAAADCIAELATDAEHRIACGKAIQQLAHQRFDMTVYATSLNSIGRDAARKFAQAELDHRLIDKAGAFDASMYFGTDHDAKTVEARSVDTYLDSTRHINFGSSPVFGVILRRPCPGFHPFIYGTEAPDFPKDGSRDPLAHYVEHGMPKGRWVHRILRPDLADVDELDVSQASVALHGHFHYPENIGDFMISLAANRFPADLFLTTTSHEVANILRAATSDYRRGSVFVDILPNVGRDIYPFLHVLREHVCGQYEFVGHLHGKRSLHTLGQDPNFGAKWRRFLWEHLLGASCRAADVIIDAMRRDTQLGLVFPENGWLIGWEKNEASAAALTRRLGRPAALPAHIEFPSGTMFWARVKALSELVQANFCQEEMPIEPLPIDGTMLHAFERMLPLLCEEAGYDYATTYIPALSN